MHQVGYGEGPRSSYHGDKVYRILRERGVLTVKGPVKTVTKKDAVFLDIEELLSDGI